MNRDVRLTIRLTDAELEALQAAAEKQDMPVSRWVRAAVLDTLTSAQTVHPAHMWPDTKEQP